ncbi:hypothetical protein [uncultured Amaricoccus sp.]|uniref:hypothetical protein n=1 Tax=uncultured Amaricoccus sp. TaxID=339341 RepID=UPI00261F5939|nr:hypothetical protein [uncultured Amaricoccus sp.]
MDPILQSLDLDAPPPGLTRPLQALWWLRKGDLVPEEEWEHAHEICQSAEGTRVYDLIHALAHWIEGDQANSDYWYRRAGARPAGADIAAEWEHQARQAIR